MKFLPLFLTAFALIPTLTHAVALSPSVMEISAKRGETVEQTLTVINTKAVEQTYYLGILKFESQENGESPKFIPFETDHSGLPEWIALPFSEFRVPANSKGEVPFEIVVPADIAAGGYYAALTVSQAPSDLVESNGALVEAKTAMLILLTVEGTTAEHLAILDFTGPDSKYRSDFAGIYKFRLQNQGNVHLEPVGTIRLEDFFGRTLIEMDANPTHAKVLPGSTREFDVSIQKTAGFVETLKKQMKFFTIGPITVDFQATYGSSGMIYAEKKFIYVPWQLLTGLLALLLIIGKIFTRSKK